MYKSWDSSIGTPTGYGLDSRGVEVRFPARKREFLLLHSVQTNYGPHPVSYPMDTEGIFSGGKATQE
jgi:hypothetical protein